jgi:hypothetical protein
MEERLEDHTSRFGCTEIDIQSLYPHKALRGGKHGILNPITTAVAQ